MKKTAKRQGKPKQLSMIPDTEMVFGGSLQKGNPKGQRPLSSKSPIHLVLKANRGFGSRSMLHPDHIAKVNTCVRRQAKALGIRLYHFVNVGNHLHLVVRIHDRNHFRSFIRAITGLIARQVLRAERGPAMQRLGSDGESSKLPEKNRSSYWVKRPFTRIANWGQDYLGLGQYMVKNLRQVRRWGQHIEDRLGAQVPGFDPDISIEPYRNSA